MFKENESEKRVLDAVVLAYKKYMEGLPDDRMENPEYDPDKLMFKAGDTGMCHRKSYFKIHGVKKTNQSSDKGFRNMRAGTLLHEDYQEAFLSMTKEERAVLAAKTGLAIKEVIVEKYFEAPNLNVRGFCDQIIIDQAGRVFVLDYKTKNTRSWSINFGRESKPGYKPSTDGLQLSFYGACAAKEYGRLDGMFLVDIKRDDGMLHVVEVPMTEIRRAIEFWKDMMEITKELPPMGNNVPGASWECNKLYCPWFDHCSALEDEANKEAGIQGLSDLI